MAPLGCVLPALSLGLHAQKARQLLIEMTLGNVVAVFHPAPPLRTLTLTGRLLIGLLVVTTVNTVISPSGVLGL
jgi:hypothetical protein